MKLTRRLFATSVLMTTVPATVLAQDRMEYRGFAVDMRAVPNAERPDLLVYLRQQIDLVESLSIRTDVKAWFRTILIEIDPTLRMAGRFYAGRLWLNARVSPSDNPVLLHELLHGYHGQRLPRTGELRAFFEQAKASGDWPAQAYMLTNIQEFFAMTASVALWGQAARPPRTREQLRQAMPTYFDWLVDEFDLQV